MDRKILDRIYAGLIGMDAGMRLGAPVENVYWTYDRLREYYGDIRGYLRIPRTMTADDDVNGPLTFVRALTDNGTVDGLTPAMVGEAWLNYTRRGMGMFWWGGEEFSTEHRAYMNLKRGVTAPASGSAEQNGLVMAEQIGGQIFVDTWGLIWPGRPEKAAEYASAAASVSHDGNGVYGGAFMAACVAAAFTAADVDEILDTAVRYIPNDCDYRKAVDLVRAFHRRHPDGFRACRDYIAETFDNPLGYHIVPNAAVCILALLYGGGDLGRSIEISVMCGYDTDCNASNIGTILGVLGGVDGLPERYRAPIRDGAVLSCVSGYLNMVDFPTCAKELYRTACVLVGEIPDESVRIPKPGELLFDFDIPGVLHGLETDDHNCYDLRYVSAGSRSGTGCAQLMIDGKKPCEADLYFKGMYTRSDLNEERYDPVFSPRVYPGQMVSAWMRFEPTAPGNLTVTPFVTCAMSGSRIDLPGVCLSQEKWQEVVFIVPDLNGDEVHDIGWHIALTLQEPPWAFDRLLIDDISVTGKMDYTIDLTRQREEFAQITPFSFNESSGMLEGDTLRFSVPELEFAAGGQAFTGNYYMRDTEMRAEVTIDEGESAMLLLRAQGTRRYYALGFLQHGEAAIVRYDSGTKTVLCRAGCDWEQGKQYRLTASAKGDELELAIEGATILTMKDSRLGYGMAGLGADSPSVSRWRGIRIKAEC